MSGRRISGRWRRQQGGKQKICLLGWVVGEQWLTDIINSCLDGRSSRADAHAVGQAQMDDGPLTLAPSPPARSSALPPADWTGVSANTIRCVAFSAAQGTGRQQAPRHTAPMPRVTSPRAPRHPRHTDQQQRNGREMNGRAADKNTDL